MTFLRVGSLCLLVLLYSLTVSAQDFLSAKIISPSQLPTGAGILAAADLNGDGITDVVYSIPGSSGTYSSFGVAFGSTSGFQVAGTYPQGLRLVTVGDLNSDGKPDLIGAVGSGPTASLLIYLNKGDGTFSGPTTTTITTDTNYWPVPVSVAMGDFDSDGKTDIIATTNDTGSFFFFHGNGDGTVAPPKLFNGRFLNSYQVTAAVDVNGDGKLDLAVYVVDGATVEVLLGNGDGTFRSEQAVPGMYNYAPIVADLNGDGIPDIATSGINTINSDFLSSSGNIYAGSGDGTFQLINSFTYSSAQGNLLAARDLNGDGKLDLIFDDANGFTVCLGLGEGQFGPPVTYAVPRWMSAGTALGDFNGDGVLDIITSFTYAGTTSLSYLLKGFSGGTFEGAEGLDVGSSPSTLATADLNHDGIPDLVASLSTGTFIYLSHGDGSYSSTNDTTPLGDQIFLADLDGDGNVDALYVPSLPSNINFRHGNGDGTFGSPIAGITLPYGVLDAVLADLNGDGKPDLVGTTDNSLWVWLGQGAGNFGAPVTYPLPPVLFAGRTVVADVNNDGIADVAVIASSNVTVLLGTGDGSGTLNPPLGSYAGSDFAVLDVNGDGKQDLVTISADPNKVGLYIYLGDGTGSFGSPTFLATSQAYAAIVAADLNLDGNPDLILTGASAVSVLDGDGRGNFGAEHVLVSADGPHNVVIGDWNHDGAPDIAVANSAGGSPAPEAISLLLNRTGETASLSLSSNPAQYGQPVSVGASIVPTVSGSATPNGTVSLTVGAVQTLQGPLANGNYSAPLVNPVVGSYAIIGSYSGDGNYLPKPFPALTLTITRANTTTSIVPSASPGIFGTTINFGITVQPAFSGVPTGGVTLWDGANQLGTVTVDNTGSANFALSSLSQGNHILSAQYAGDANFVTSTSAPLTETVLYPTTVSIASNALSALIGSTVTLTSTIGSPYGGPTGNVTFIDGAVVLGQAVLAGGTATFSSSTLSQGIHSIKVSYQGDSTFVAGNSSVISQAMTDFSVAATNPSLTLNAGASGTYSIEVSPLSDFSGSVGFTCTGAPELATCTVSPASVQVSSGSVSAVVTVTTTGPGQAVQDHERNLWILATLSAPAFGFIGLLGRLSRRKSSLVLLLLVLFLVSGMSACGGTGGGSSTPQPARTPSGTSSLLLTAATTANGGTVNHAVTLTLKVN